MEPWTDMAVRKDHAPLVEQSMFTTSTTAAAVAAVAAIAATTDRFVASMTFTRPMERQCDCDECDVGSGSGGFIPAPIRLAIREHKRMKRDANGIARTQVRTLMRRFRDSRVALWQWLLPPSATELVLEFGNPLVYRIIWVQRLPIHVRLQRPGLDGIVGSQREEQGRVTLDWQAGDVILWPSCTGQAVGWGTTCTSDALPEAQTEEDTADNDIPTKHGTTSIQTTGGPVVLYIAKIMLEEEELGGINSTPEDLMANDADDKTVASIRAILQRAIQRSQISDPPPLNGAAAVTTPVVVSNSYKLDPADAHVFRDTVSKLMP